jgi:hypothetical protein
MADSATLAAYATAAGTLVLAVATFASVRSANNAARTAERSLQVGLRPLLFPSRLEDPIQKIRWGDTHWASLDGGKATFELSEGVIYLALSLRNVGSGIAVIHSWRGEEWAPFSSSMHAPELDEFRPQTRDLYVPPGDVGFWQAAIRDHDDLNWPRASSALDARSPLLVDLLYGDYEGGQRTISRFLMSPVGEDQVAWLGSVVRHWNLDRPDPRR